MLNWKNSTGFLSVFRGFAFLLAVAQILAGSSALDLSIQTVLVLVLVAAYTIAKILIPFRWYRKDLLTYLVLSSDVVVCIGLPFLTGGLSSGFLLYSLNPILTMALMLKRSTALGSATLASLAIAAAQVWAAPLNLPVASSLASPADYLGALLVYIILCYMAAVLPFLINDNIYQRIQAKATADERNRLSREMHDNLAQSVGYLKLKTRQLKNLLSPQDEHLTAEVREMMFVVDELYTDIREALGLLRISTLDNAGLIATLADQVKEFSRQTGIKADLSFNDGRARLSTLAELHILRVVQEALTNVRKHAYAKSVAVRFESEANFTNISIKDDGRGFNFHAQNLGKNKEHIGLGVMQERVEALGGTMIVNSRPGQGTDVSFIIPMTQEVMRDGRDDKLTARR